MQLEADLASLEQYRDLRDLHEEEVSSMRDGTAAKATEHEDQMFALERKFLMEKSAAQKVSLSVHEPALLHGFCHMSRVHHESHPVRRLSCSVAVTRPHSVLADVWQQ